MATLAAGASITLTLAAGEVLSMEPGGSGVAVLGPGEGLSRQYRVGPGPGKVGPFAASQVVYLSSTGAAISYMQGSGDVALGGSTTPATVVSALQTADAGQKAAAALAIGVPVRQPTSEGTFSAATLKVGEPVTITPGAYNLTMGDSRAYLPQAYDAADGTGPGVIDTQTTATTFEIPGAFAGRYMAVDEVFINGVGNKTGSYKAKHSSGPYIIGPVADLAARMTAVQFVAGLGMKGMNLGQSLEAYTIDADQIVTQQLITYLQSTGITHVRLPVRSSSNAALTADATLSTAVKTRVHQILGWCQTAGIRVLFDPLHHYRRFVGDASGTWTGDPSENSLDSTIIYRRAVNILAQWAKELESHGDFIAFDLVNEPNAISDVTLNAYYAEVSGVMRKYTRRPFIIEPASQGSIYKTVRLDWSPFAGNAQAGLGFHPYAPHQYSHQANGANIAWQLPYLAAIDCVVQSALWEQERIGGVALHAGEFGVNIYAPSAGRPTYIQAVRQTGEARGISGAAWMYGSDFALLDNNAGTWSWKTGMQAAMTGNPASVGSIPASLITPTQAGNFRAQKPGGANAILGTDYTIAGDGTVTMQQSMAFDGAKYTSGHVDFQMSFPVQPNTTYQITAAFSGGCDMNLVFGKDKAIADTHPWYSPDQQLAGTSTDLILADKGNVVQYVTTPASVGTDCYVNFSFWAGPSGVSKGKIHVCVAS